MRQPLGLGLQPQHHSLPVRGGDLLFIVELKHPGRTNYKPEERIEDQVRRYVANIKGGKIEGFGRRKIRVSADCKFHCLVVADFHGRLADEISGWDYIHNAQGCEHRLGGKRHGSTSKPDEPVVWYRWHRRISPRLRSASFSTKMAPRQASSCGFVLIAWATKVGLRGSCGRIFWSNRSANSTAPYMTSHTLKAGQVKQRSQSSVVFVPTRDTRKLLSGLTETEDLAPTDFLLTSLRPQAGQPQPISGRTYLNLVKKLVGYTSLNPEVYGTHSVRRSRPAFLYGRRATCGLARSCWGTNPSRVNASVSGR